MHSLTILVTGCAGFIGSNVVVGLRKHFPSASVIGIDDLSSGRRNALHPELTFYEGSIADQKLVETIFQTHRPVHVLHFAALPRVGWSVAHPVETSNVNIMGTIGLLEAAHRFGARRFIHASTSAVYGDTKVLPTKEDTFPVPASPYALQKWTGEQFCSMFSTLYGLDTVSLRYFNVFGPGDYGDSLHATVIAAWLEALYFPDQKQAVLEGNGLQTRDFCYIDDVIEAVLLAMTSDREFKGECINIASGKASQLTEILRLIEHHAGKPLTLTHVVPRSGDVVHTLADISKARELLGYAPQVTLEEGILRTIAWFRERNEK